MLFQPSNITPDELNGTGTVDVTEDVKVSWFVNGTSALVAYEIAFFQNNAASTAVYSTGKVTLDSPFWGTSYDGTVEYFTVTLSSLDSHGLSNGNEYKMLITQWWSESDSVTQTTASIFITRDAPSVEIDDLPDPLTDKEASFTATYSQAQYDSIQWVRWEIAYADDTENPFSDTGKIYGTGELRIDYDGFLTDTTYAIRCTVETSNGVQATTGWQEFDVSYVLAAASGAASACQLKNTSCVWIRWDQVQSADGYSIMRQTVGEQRLIKIADVSATVGQIQDYSARSGQSYIYYVFPEGSLAYLTEPMQTEPVNVQYWYWSIVEATPMSGEKNTYSVIRAFIFRYGASGVAEGQWSNNNSPQLSLNFTRYPTRYGSSANYKTGTVSGYIGTISEGTLEYQDTVAQSDALFDLSNSKNALFLLTPKGHYLRIHTAAATTMQIDHKKRQMPQTVTISWAETGSTDGVHLIMYPGNDFYPMDRVIMTVLRIDTATGRLLWIVPDNYEGTGSTLSLDADGSLIHTTGGPFIAATLEMDQSTGIVTATLDES